MNKRRTRPNTPIPPSFRQETVEDDSVMGGGMFALIAVAAVLLLLFLAVRFGTASIENDIEGRANGLLEANGLVSVNAEATGTDVELTGTVVEGTNDEAIFAAVADLDGVTSVTGKLWEVGTGDDTPVEITGESIEIEWTPFGVTVRGDISSDERKDAMSAALDDAFPSVNVDGLHVVEGLADENPWLGSVLGLVISTADEMTDGLVIVAPGQELLIVSGEVEDKDRRNALNTHIGEVAAEIGFDVNPAVRVPDTAPTQEEVDELQDDLNELVLDKVVEFRTKSDELTDSGKALLDDILVKLEAAPDIRVEIAGHADADGSEEANMALSKARAMAVLAYLVAHGQDEDRFDVLWFGESQPIADNNTAEGRARNRRIEFKALLDEETDQ
ncbi:MAG: OmpA family protein [Acidimicrobiia bacterium]|nr:OmpA family protein [Acidimicrobiia bacterium]